MTTLPLQTVDTAAPSAASTLEGAQKQLGFVPNLYATLANSPLALEAYTSLAQTISSKTTLSVAEQQVALIAISIENGCDYCVAAHSTIAAGQKVPEEVLEAVRNGTPFADPRLEAIRTLSVQLVQKRGWLDPSDLAAFTNAGLEAGEVLDIVTFTALKTISNYTNHIAETPLDAPFEPRRFESDRAARQTA